MTACAARRAECGVSANVLCNSFRSPALLDKMGATLDVISGGRFELAIASGWHEPETRLWLRLPSPGTRIDQPARPCASSSSSGRGAASITPDAYYT